MTAIEQKKQEYVMKLQNLRNSKQAEINRKVEEYRKQLMAQMNSAEEAKIQNVIDALNKVIEYERVGQ